MPYRLAMFGIAVFWMVMTGLLIRLEVRPDKSTILNVPVSYVMRVMFKNGQPSALALRDQTDRAVGSVSLRPHITAEGQRVLDFAANIAVELPMMARQRLNLSGTMAMDKALQVQDFTAELIVQHPPMRLDLQGDPGKRLLHYQLYEQGKLTDHQTLPLEMSAIVPALLQGFGAPFDASALPLVQGNLTAPSLFSRETYIPFHGEQLDVFQLSLQEGSTKFMDIYVSQLGQIIMAHSSFGYSLTSQDFQ